MKFGDSVKMVPGQALLGNNFRMHDSFADRTSMGGESISNLFNGLTVGEQHEINHEFNGVDRQVSNPIGNSLF